MPQLPVRAIAFSPSGGHALSASEGERQIALWALPAKDGAAPSKKSRPSVGLLSMEEPAVQLVTSAVASSTPNEASSFQVMACCSCLMLYKCASPSSCCWWHASIHIPVHHSCTISTVMYTVVMRPGTFGVVMCRHTGLHVLHVSVTVAASVSLWR